ncbi:Avirulence (Avh) protein, partial [Phytophthora megakarya]
FGDVSVTTMIHAAKATDATKAIATKLESAQQKMWLSSEKSIDDVFELLLQTNGKSTFDVFIQLKVYKHKNDFRNNPLFDTWISYINFFIKEKSDKKAAVISALETRFADRPLNIILEEMKKFPSMKNAAERIQTDKIQTYLASNKSPGKVFELLGLDEVGFDVLKTPLFKTWLNYLDLFKKKNPKDQTSLLVLLQNHYHNVVAIQEMIDLALQIPHTVKIGKMVENELLRRYLDWKYLPESVFRFLDLNKVGVQIFAAPKFQTWVKYLDDFNERYPAHKTTMIDAFRGSFKDGNVLTILKAAKNDPTTTTLVPGLENVLINKWVVEKETLVSLKTRLGTRVYSDEMQHYIEYMVQRFNKEISGNVS